jgi:hypothetical protein
MIEIRVWVCVALLLGCVLPISARQSDSSSVAVPPYINFSGVLADVNGKPMMTVAGVTFSLYKDSQGGAPVWMETQNVRPDRLGHYIVMLGATISSGLPSDIFLAGEARWLGVQVQGQEEQPRVLLVAVPYALKAGDAETIRGLPPSAFVLATPATLGPSTAANTAAIKTASSIVLSTAPPSASNVTTTGGTVNALPLWTTSTNIQNSTVSQTGSGSTAKIGIGTTTPLATLDVKGAVNIQGILTAPAIGTVNAGTFSNTQTNQYVSSLIGGLSPNFYHDACPSCGYTTEALTGGVAVPLGAPIYQANALSGYVSSACNSFSRTTCNTVPVFGLGIATANGAAVWGANYVAEDQPGLSTNITGNEIDVGVSGTPTFVRGLNITLSPPAPSHIPGTMPATSLNCFGLGGSGCPGAAMEINASSPLLQWQKGIILTDSSFNSSLPAIEIGATSYNAANLGSYKLNFARWDAGTVRHSDVSISANSAGDMLLSAAGGRAVNVGGGGANFASLPAASNGSLIYCNDCKNVADDAATAGAACVGSGSGALARRQNRRWDCN